MVAFTGGRHGGPHATQLQHRYRKHHFLPRGPGQHLGGGSRQAPRRPRAQGPPGQLTQHGQAPAPLRHADEDGPGAAAYRPQPPEDEQAALPGGRQVPDQRRAAGQGHPHHDRHQGVGQLRPEDLQHRQGPLGQLQVHGSRGQGQDGRGREHLHQAGHRAPPLMEAQGRRQQGPDRPAGIPGRRRRRAAADHHHHHPHQRHHQGAHRVPRRVPDR